MKNRTSFSFDNKMKRVITFFVDYSHVGLTKASHREAMIFCTFYSHEEDKIFFRTLQQYWYSLNAKNRRKG